MTGNAATFCRFFVPGIGRWQRARSMPICFAISRPSHYLVPVLQPIECLRKALLLAVVKQIASPYSESVVSLNRLSSRFAASLNACCIAFNSFGASASIVPS